MITNYPVASFLSPNVCVGIPLTFSNLTTGSGLSFLWNFGDTTSGKLNYSTLQNPSHVYNTPGIYNVTFSVTNLGGCASSIAQNTNVTVQPIVRKWTYKVSNQTVTFIPGDTTMNTYEWFFGTGDSISAKNPVYTYQSKGKYDVKLAETNATGCSGSYSDSITLTGLGVETITGPENNLNISIFPNPFESKTIVSYILTCKSIVNVSIFNIQGKLVAELKNGTYEAGKYHDEFDAVKYNATEGVYLVKMTVNGAVFTGRIILIK